MDIDVFKDIVGKRVGLASFIREIVLMEHNLGIVFEVTTQAKLDEELRTGKKLYEKIGIYDHIRSQTRDEVFQEFRASMHDAKYTFGKASQENVSTQISQMMTSGEFEDAGEFPLSFHKPLKPENIKYWSHLVTHILYCRIEALRAGYEGSGELKRYGGMDTVKTSTNYSYRPDQSIVVMYKCDRQRTTYQGYSYQRENKEFKDGILCKIFTLLWK